MGYKPRIRFKGFTEDWEQREFSDIFAEVKSGLSRMLSNDDIGLPVVRANNINDGQLNLFDDIKYWYKNDPQGANTNNYLIEQGDILINFINSEAKMGTAAYVTRRPERDTIYTTNILRCKVNDEYNPYFIYSLTFLNSYKNYIASITKPAVNQASFTTVDFKKYSIKIPTVKEQNQIANLIEIFNKFITLHQCKLEKLKLTKKALLQKLFPKNGKHIPEIRFKGFTDAWEQRKLNDFGIATGGTSIESEFVDGGTYKVISIGSYSEESVYNDQGLRVNKTDKTKFRILNKDDLTMILNDKTASGNIIGRVLLIDQDNTYVYNQRTERIEVDTKNFLPMFLYHMLNAPEQRKYIVKASQGNTQIYVNWSTINNIDYMIPQLLLEQEKIANLFSLINKDITLHQRKLERLQEVKKGLLQKMFV